MAQRLVTQDDLNKYPELKGKGVSVNQHYDFSYLEANATPPVAKIVPKKSEPKETSKKK